MGSARRNAVTFAVGCVVIALAGAFAAIIPPTARATGSAVVPDSSIGGFTPIQFPGNDDGSYSDETGPVTVPFGFDVNFFGTKYSGAYVNNNGNITFDTSLPTFTPFDLAGASTVIVAPFLADVDTRVGNTAEFGTGTLGGHNVFVVNWPGVGCFDRNTSVTNDFQLILVDRADRGTGALGDDFDIEFNYNSIQWDTGQANTGDSNCTTQPGSTSAAAVGYSDGTGAPGGSVQLPGSQSAGALLDSDATTGLINSQLNSGVPGRYVFPVHQGQPPAPTSLTTSLSGGGQPPGTSITVPAGTSVTDAGTLSGPNAASATGTVSYSVFSDAACTQAVDTGSALDITTPGTLPSSAPVSLSTPGTYYWQASYSGDANNASATSTCGTGGEIETVTAPSAPNAPTIDSLTAGDGSVTVSFEASAGGAPATAFVASCTSPSGADRSKGGFGSPLVVSGLTNGAPYTCSVVARNSVGDSAPSARVGPVAPTSNAQRTDTCTGQTECQASVPQPAGKLAPAQSTAVTGTPSDQHGSVVLTASVGRLGCRSINGSKPGPVTELFDRGFSRRTRLTVTMSLKIASSTTPEQVCYNSDIPFFSQGSPTVKRAGTGYLLLCSKVNNVAPCVVSTKQVGAKIVVKFVVPGGDPRMALSLPRGRLTFLGGAAVAKLGQPFFAQLQQTGGKSPVHWKLSSGTQLPSGLVLSTTGVISGKPKVRGLKTAVVAGTDSAKPPVTAKLNVPIKVI